jgi:hypothetical protein
VPLRTIGSDVPTPPPRPFFFFFPFIEHGLLDADIAIYTGVQREMRVSPAIKYQQLVGKE